MARWFFGEDNINMIVTKILYYAILEKVYSYSYLNTTIKLQYIFSDWNVTKNIHSSHHYNFPDSCPFRHASGEDVPSVETLSTHTPSVDPSSLLHKSARACLHAES